MYNDTNEQRGIALIHRVIVPDMDHPKEYAILVTYQSSTFIRQPKSRSDFSLRGEIKFGTAVVTDVIPKTLQDYKETSLEALSDEPTNSAIPHGSVVSLAMRGDEPKFRAREFFVKWTMQRQNEIFKVYNFNMRYRASDGEKNIQFYAVPLGAYFKPRRQTQTRQVVLREYAEDILQTYRKVLPTGIVSAQF